MKRILIVDKSFAVGGIQTALINMVKELKNHYEIDVLMFYNNGTLKKHFPNDVRIITPCSLLRLHGMSLQDAKKQNLFLYLLRYITGVVDKVFTNRFSIWFAMLFQKKLCGYDAAIAFHHEDSPKATVSGFYRFVTQKTDARIKLGWIHYDPEFVTFDDLKNEKYMKQMDKIICVSKGTEEKFLMFHPQLKGKTDFCYNFQDIDRILRLSKEKANVQFDSTKFNCFSACRLDVQKAIPRAIKVFSKVLRKHGDVVWYVAGDGRDREECERLIREEKMESQIVLLGAVDNPFVYMTQCDLYIQPSKYEAAPMAYGEAMICKAPILTTQNISSSEMVDSRYGFICENTEEGMEEKLSYLLENRDVVYTRKTHLTQHAYSNAAGLSKIKQLLEGET